MNNQQIIDWLLEGDVSIQYQVCRDLLGSDKKNLQTRIAKEGWVRKFYQNVIRTANGEIDSINPNESVQNFVSGETNTKISPNLHTEL